MFSLVILFLASFLPCICSRNSFIFALHHLDKPNPPEAEVLGQQFPLLHQLHDAAAAGAPGVQLPAPPALGHQSAQVKDFQFPNQTEFPTDLSTGWRSLTGSVWLSVMVSFPAWRCSLGLQACSALMRGVSSIRASPSPATTAQSLNTGGARITTSGSQPSTHGDFKTSQAGSWKYTAFFFSSAYQEAACVDQ